MNRIAVAGALGRLGSLVLERVAADADACVAAALVSPNDARLGQSTEIGRERITYTDRCGAAFDVLIDVTNPAASMHWLDECRSHNRPIVIGTTGHSAEEQAQIERTASFIPVLKATNFSVGVAVLTSLVDRVSRTLGATHDIEIVEVHHAQKADAPSGTALTLLDTVLNASAQQRREHVAFGRFGRSGPRPTHQVGVHSLRMGDHAGTHTVYFSKNGETLSLSHQATSRACFADGALSAAKWLLGKPPGLYSMANCFAD